MVPRARVGEVQGRRSWQPAGALFARAGEGRDERGRRDGGREWASGVGEHGRNRTCGWSGCSVQRARGGGKRLDLGITNGRVAGLYASSPRRCWRRPVGALVAAVAGLCRLAGGHPHTVRASSREALMTPARTWHRQRHRSRAHTSWIIAPISDFPRERTEIRACWGLEALDRHMSPSEPAFPASDWSPGTGDRVSSLSPEWGHGDVRVPRRPHSACRSRSKQTRPIPGRGVHRLHARRRHPSPVLQESKMGDRAVGVFLIRSTE